MRYLVCFLGNAISYMQIVKWVATLFRLRMNGQRTAVPGSVLTILFICPGPMIALALCMIATRRDPEEFSVFFPSLILVTMLNQLDGLREVDRSRWFPDSVWLIVFINFVVYGSGVILFRTFVIVRIESLLNRRRSVAGPVGPPSVQ